MSIKTTKRIALGVIASLVFAPFAALAPASAVDGTATATVSPVRYSAGDTVPVATLKFTVPSTITTGLVDAATAGTLTVTQAPTNTAEVNVDNCGGANGGLMKDTLAGSGTALAKGDTPNALHADAAASAEISCDIFLTAATAASGTYKGTILFADDGTGGTADNVTVNWSFTTTGKVASITTDVTSVSIPAIAATGNTDVTFKNVTLTLKDAAGNTTQAASGDSLTVAIDSATNIALKTASGQAPAASLTIQTSDISDGTHTFTVASETATADSEKITITPLGIMPAQGVAAITLTATTTGYGVETNVKTVLTTPSATNLVKAGTVSAGGAESAYTVDTSVTSLVFTASGYTVGAAYKITVTGVTGTPAFTVKDDTSNTTASASNTNAKNLYGIVGASGSVVVTVVIASTTTADVIGISADNATTTSVGSADARVTYTAATYSVSVSTPTVTPSLAVTSTPVAFAGKVADTYGNPVSGAVVTITGTVTPTGTALTGTATSAADGSWSVTMPASAATTTSVSYVAAAVKTGISISSASAVVVNFNATGSPDTLTYDDALSDQDTATTVNPVTTYPASTVIYTGSTGAGNSNEVYTIATAANDGELNATDVCVAFTPTTSPAGQVVVTGSAGVKFTTTSCATAQTLASLKDTVTVASGSAFYAVATKTGENSVTMTSGTKTASARFYAFNSLTAASAGDAIRNLTADKASLSLKPGEFAVITIAAKDAFGNAVKSAVAAGGATVTVTGAGSALVEGPTLSKQFTTTDANGNIMVGVVASQTPGTGTITITGTGAQLGAAAGAATSATAGTNGLTAASARVTVSVTVAAVEPEVVYEKPTLNIAQKAGRVILSGTAENEEGDIIVYIKRIGKTAWVERAKTFEVAAPGDFNGSIKAPKGDVVIRVKQEGTGLFSNQVIVLKP